MQLIDIVEYDAINYKKPSMFLLFPHCTFKCERECGKPVCQNARLHAEPMIEVPITSLIDKYLDNPLTHAVVCGGLEPFDSHQDLFNFIHSFRECSDDDIVIYTGYTEEELAREINSLSKYKNIIIKFGRYKPDMESHYDEILGVNLASPNQYGKIL